MEKHQVRLERVERQLEDQIHKICTGPGLSCTKTVSRCYEDECVSGQCLSVNEELPPQGLSVIDTRD